MSSNLEWDNEDSLRLLDLYEKHSVLWNTRHTYYYNKAKKQKAWEAVARACEVPAAEVKRKMESLLSSFRRERCKSRKRKAAAEADENRRSEYVSRWFAYKKMSFLLDKEEQKEFPDYDDDVSLHDDAEQITGDAATTIASEDSSPLFAVEAVYEPTDCEESSGAQPAKLPAYRTKQSKTIVPFKMLKGGKRPASDSEEDSMADINEAVDILKTVATKARRSRGDGCSTYGEHIANKLRGYEKRTKAFVEHHINNILFQADMGEFESTAKSSIQSNSHQRSVLNGSVDSSFGLPSTSS